MKYTRLGKSDIKVSPICFGAWAIGGWMWGGADRKKAVRAIEASIEMGITSIDTAPIYGFGLSEEIVGEVISSQRDRVQIMTKFGVRWDTSQGKYTWTTHNNEGDTTDIHRYAGKDGIILECERSLKRLQTEYIDLYQIHWPDTTTPVEESMEALERLIDDGKILAAGVSNYAVPDMALAGKVIPIASNQVPYSMLKRDIEDDIIPYCIDNNISIIVYSPMQRGILSGKFSPDHKFKEGDNRPETPYYKKVNIALINAFLDELRPLAEGKNASLAQLVIRWTLQQPGVTTVLAGIRDEQQLRDNAGALSFVLSGEEIQFINNKLEDLELEMD